MNRISKARAASIAESLTEKHREDIAKMYEPLKEKAYALAVGTIPSVIFKAFKENRDYFSHTSTINLTGPGLNHDSIVVDKDLPTTGYRITLLLEQQDAIFFEKALMAIRKKKEKVNTLKANIEALVFQLATPAKLEREFPEAFKFLPKESRSTALAININDLRKQLIG